MVPRVIPAAGEGREDGHPARGRPLSERTDEAIRAATAALLDERALSEFTVEDVANRAKVSKASVYRRWPSKGTLAFDAFMADFVKRQPLADTGTLRGDLLAALQGWVRAVRRPKTARTLRGLLAEAQSDPELADAWRERFVEPLRARHRAIMERAVGRGELPPSADVGLLLDLLYGPAYHRLLHRHLPLTDDFVVAVVDAVMAAAAAIGGGAKS